MSKKEITFFISSLRGGGAEGVCVNIANGLVEEGWKVDLVVLNLNNSIYQARVSDKVNLVVLGVNHVRHALFPIKTYLKNHKPDKILVFNFEISVLLVLIRKIFGYSFSIVARNINTLSQKRLNAKGIWEKYIVHRMIDLLYCRVDHIINQCKAMEADLLTLFPNLDGKTSVIYNPVNKNIEDFSNTIDYNNIKKHDYLLCVGRLEPQKSFHYAIQSFAVVAKYFPKLRLKIVGQGSLDKELKDYALQCGVVNRIDFEGFQKNIIPYYLHANATLLTSEYEGFPNVLIESITLGTPVISFDCKSGPKEIIQDGVNGVLVKNRDVEVFSKNLSNLIASDYNTYNIIESSQKYKVKNIISQYSSFFCNLAALDSKS